MMSRPQGHTTVDRDGLTGDVRSRIRHQQYAERCYVRRIAEARLDLRQTGGKSCLARKREVLLVRALDCAWRDRIGAHSGWTMPDGHVAH
jgi:hypothetical protein